MTKNMIKIMVLMAIMGLAVIAEMVYALSIMFVSIPNGFMPVAWIVIGLIGIMSIVTLIKDSK